MITAGNNFFNDYCNTFKSIALDKLGMSAAELLSEIKDLPELAKATLMNKPVFINIVPDITGDGPNRDQLTDEVSAGFFFFVKMNPKERAQKLQPVMNDTLELVLRFRNEVSKINGTCSFLERINWQTLTISPFFNLSEFYGWGIEFKIDL